MLESLRKIGFSELQFDTGEVILNYVAGPPNGPPLVLIPGQTLPWDSYQRVLPELSRHFRTYAIDIRGHGKSGWTPGRYTITNIGKDLAALIRDIISEPAFVSGNSSGGLLSVWLAANAPTWVRAIIPEDPPLFSSEMPRFRDDLYVYKVFELCADTIGTFKKLDLSRFFARFEVPVQGKKHVLKIPRFLSAFISSYVRLYQFLRPGQPIDIPFLPLGIRVFVKGLSMYDPNFTRAFLDGTAMADFDHASALSKVKCPMLLIHANWFRHEKYGLVGAMDDNDVKRVRSIVPGLHYVKINAGHTIHIEKPRIFIKEIVRFTLSL
jgi:pimeloyl-ACP methyl ester carboxylesterase